jgi:hypothetical protein
MFPQSFASVNPFQQFTGINPQFTGINPYAGINPFTAAGAGGATPYGVNPVFASPFGPGINPLGPNGPGVNLPINPIVVAAQLASAQLAAQLAAQQLAAHQVAVQQLVAQQLAQQSATQQVPGVNPAFGPSLTGHSGLPSPFGGPGQIGQFGAGAVNPSLLFGLGGLPPVLAAQIQNPFIHMLPLGGVPLGTANPMVAGLTQQANPLAQQLPIRPLMGPQPFEQSQIGLGAAGIGHNPDPYAALAQAHLISQLTSPWQFQAVNPWSYASRGTVGTPLSTQTTQGMPFAHSGIPSGV